MDALTVNETDPTRVFSPAQDLLLNGEMVRMMQQVCTSLDKAASPQQSASVAGYRAQSALMELHRQLREGSETYRAALKQAELPHDSAEPSPWRWQELFEDQQGRCGLLSVFQGHPIPIHDHGDGSVVLMSLVGCINITEFEVAASHGSTVELRIDNQYSLTPGVAGAQAGPAPNIHTVSADTPVCVVLEVHTPPYERHERAWYYPFSATGPEDGDQRLISQRVRIGSQPVRRARID